jgi:hypothetical protein
MGLDTVCEASYDEPRLRNGNSEASTVATPLVGTESGKNSIQRVHYTHDAMIDLVLMKPGIAQGEIAKYFGYTEAWVSRVMGSDAFQARLAERKTELVDPTILASLDEKLKGLVHQSIDILTDKLNASKNPDTALKVLELGTKALGFGARPQNIAQQTNNYVVALPAKAVDEEKWAQDARAAVRPLPTPKAPQGEVTDVVPK